MCVYFGGSLCILKAFTQLMSLNLVRIKTAVTIGFITLYALGENVVLRLPSVGISRPKTGYAVNKSQCIVVADEREHIKHPWAAKALYS